MERRAFQSFANRPVLAFQRIELHDEVARVLPSPVSLNPCPWGQNLSAVCVLLCVPVYALVYIKSGTKYGMMIKWHFVTFYDPEHFPS
jgi:hypothetical protein